MFAPIFSSYHEACEYVANKSNRPYPGSKRSTRVIYSHYDHTVSIRYHWTDVVIYTDMWMYLNTNGYQTTTTKRRINDSLIGARIWQEKFVWYVSGSNGTFHYHDGMKVTYQGEVIPAKDRSLIAK